MTRQTGQIVAADSSGGTVTVSIRKSTACSHGSCSHRLLPDTNKELQVEALNPIGASIGEFVEISFETRAALWTAFAVYILPIVVGIGFHLLATNWSMAYPWLWALASGGVTMSLGLYRGNQLQSQCTITRRMEPTAISQTTQDACAGCPFR